MFSEGRISGNELSGSLNEKHSGASIKGFKPAGIININNSEGTLVEGGLSASMHDDHLTAKIK